MKQKAMTISELVIQESRMVATEMIEAGLAKHSLPLPKDAALDFHIDALLKARPDLIEIAQRRVDAKHDAYSTMLRAIGIEPVIIEALELELDEPIESRAL